MPNDPIYIEIRPTEEGWKAVSTPAPGSFGNSGGPSVCGIGETEPEALADLLHDWHRARVQDPAFRPTTAPGSEVLRV